MAHKPMELRLQPEDFVKLKKMLEEINEIKGEKR
jgi:hypothetical protein